MLPFLQQPLAALCRPGDAPGAGRTRLWTALALLVAGWGFFAWFFDGGNLALDFEDWPKERVYLDAFRQALSEGRIPWHLDRQLQMTQRFLALPETSLGPHLLLLPFLSHGQFILVTVGLAFSAGLLGAVRLARHEGWSAFVLASFVILVAAGGYLTSRLAVGHFMWTGYLLSPWLLLSLRTIEDPSHDWRAGLPFAWAVLGLFCLGSFHLAIWWWMLLAAWTLARPASWRPAAVALAGSALLAAWRLLPAAVTFAGADRDFGTGYADVWAMLRGFVDLEGYAAPPDPDLPIPLGWWEFDHYIGLPALAAVLVFAARGARSGVRDHGPWLFAAGVLAFFALSFAFAPIASLPLPLASTERITSRFVSVAFLAALIPAGAAATRSLATTGPGLRIAAAGWLCVTLLALATHARLWHLPALEAAHPPSAYWPDSATMRGNLATFERERGYRLVVAGSAALSTTAFAASLLIARRRRPGPPHADA